MKEEGLKEEMGEEEAMMQQLRSKATDLLIREEWEESIQAYSHFISLCQCHNQISTPHHPHCSKLQRSLCLALSNRAEARSRLREFSEALKDCDLALAIEATHFKTLLCKGKILLHLNRYSAALDCFKAALLHPQASANSETLDRYLDRCQKLEFQARTGVFDLSDWVLSGFRGKSPELAEYVGAIQIKKSEISGRGIFASKSMDAGTLVLCTKASAIERAILPADESGESLQLVMWKKFIDKVTESAVRCRRMRRWIRTLSAGEEDESSLEVPDIALFKAEAEESGSFSDERVDRERILSTMDVNSLVEDAAPAKKLGKTSEFYGVGFWVLTAFINHSCVPNARRLHVGDHVVVHASRDIKAGEEITFAYFDVLSPLHNRQKMSQNWGFSCNCRRCLFEKEVCSKPELREIEIGIEKGIDMGGSVCRLEEGMRRWVVRGKDKGYIRASFWGAYSAGYASEKFVNKWGRRIPSMELVVDSIVGAVGGDERILQGFIEELKRSKGGSLVQKDKAMKLGRGVFGKVMKKQAMKTLLEFDIFEQTY